MDISGVLTLYPNQKVFSFTKNRLVPHWLAKCQFNHLAIYYNHGYISCFADWGPKIDVVGFCFLDLASNYEPPETLLNWLKAGPRPIYIGFGSLVSLASFISQLYALREKEREICFSSCWDRKELIWLLTWTCSFLGIKFEHLSLHVTLNSLFWNLEFEFYFTVVKPHGKVYSVIGKDFSTFFLYKNESDDLMENEWIHVCSVHPFGGVTFVVCASKISGWLWKN